MAINFTISNRSTLNNHHPIARRKYDIPIDVKWKMFAIGGTYTIIIKQSIVPISIGNNAAFFTFNIWIMLCVHERLTRINEIFHITNVTNAAVLTTVSGCPNRMNILYIANVVNNTNNHCNMLKNNVLLPKSDSLGLRGKRDMMFASSLSPSNITEHAGSIINSIKTTCIGYNIIGRHKNIGSTIIHAYGIWTLTI